MGTIIENIQEGTEIRNYPADDIMEIISSAFDNYEFIGYDLEFFSKENLKRLVDHIRKNHGQLTNKEISDIMVRGLSGEYGKNPREIKGYTIIGWIREYMKKRDDVTRRMNQNSVFNANLTGEMSKFPMGSAILLKMDFIPTSDWDKVDTKELARILQDKGKDAALTYASEVCNAKVYLK